MTTKKPTTKKTTAEKQTTADGEKTLMEFINSLDMDDLDMVENLSGMSLEQLEIPGHPKTRFLYAVGLVAAKRVDPSISWAEIRRKPMPEIVNYAKNAPEKKYTAEATTVSAPQNAE